MLHFDLWLLKVERMIGFLWDSNDRDISDDGQGMSSETTTERNPLMDLSPSLLLAGNQG